MNCWVFTPAVLRRLDAVFDEFLREHGHDERAESPLPEAVNSLVQTDRAGVTVEKRRDRGSASRTPTTARACARVAGADGCGRVSGAAVGGGLIAAFSFWGSKSS